MRELWGLLKAIFTDLSGGFHPRKFKNPAEDIPIWQIGQEIRDYTDLLKMSRDEMSEDQRQALLDDDEEARKANTVLHIFPPSKGEAEELRQHQEETEESAPGQEEAQDADEDASPAQEQETEDSEGSSDPIEGSYFTLGLNEESFSGDSFDVDLEE